MSTDSINSEEYLTSLLKSMSRLVKTSNAIDDEEESASLQQRILALLNTLHKFSEMQRQNGLLASTSSSSNALKKMDGIKSNRVFANNAQHTDKELYEESVKLINTFLDRSEAKLE